MHLKKHLVEHKLNHLSENNEDNSESVQNQSESDFDKNSGYAIIPAM